MGTSKRSVIYIYTLLIHGACSVLYYAKEPSAWVEQLSKCRPLNVVTVALVIGQHERFGYCWPVIGSMRKYVNIKLACVDWY